MTGSFDPFWSVTLTASVRKAYGHQTAVTSTLAAVFGESMYHIVFVNVDELGGAQDWAFARESDGTVWLFIRRDRVNPIALTEIWRALLGHPAIAA